MFDTLKDFDQRNNVAFASYYQCFNAMKQASYAAHVMATKCTEDFKKTLDLEAERMCEYTEELQQRPSEAVESEVDEEFLKFYEESLKYKKEKSRTSYLNRCLTRFE